MNIADACKVRAGCKFIGKCPSATGWCKTKGTIGEDCAEFIFQHIDNLNARLKNAIELPVKDGDKIFVVPSKARRALNEHRQMHHLNEIIEQRVRAVKVYSYDYVAETTGFLYVHPGRFLGETWFLTRDEAERALMENRENAKNVSVEEVKNEV